jgi:hypothetical protein
MPIDKTSMFVLIINVHLMTLVNKYNKSIGGVGKGKTILQEMGELQNTPI